MTTAPVRTEAQLLAFVKQAARAFGFVVFHNLYAVGSDKGWPDIVAIHPFTGRLVVAELKGPRGYLTPHQQAWLAAWRTVKGAEVYVWKSGQEDEILDVLRGHKHPRIVCEPCGVAHP